MSALPSPSSSRNYADASLSSLSSLPIPSRSSSLSSPSICSKSPILRAAGSTPLSLPSVGSSSGPVDLTSDSGSDPSSDSEPQDCASLFRPGHYRCPADSCDFVAPSDKILVDHASDHNSGLQLARISLDHFVDSLGFIGCPRCLRFFKMRGLKNHQRACKGPIGAPPDSERKSDDSGDLPSLNDIFSSNRPTLTFVPAAHRQIWGRILSKELYEARSKNSLEAWTRLFMLPKCVLAAPKRGGKRNRGDNQTVTDLCDAWERGELEWLWRRSFRPPTASKSHSADSQRVLDTAILHARHGRLGKACAALSSSGLAPDTEATWSKLQHKHPQSSPPSPSGGCGHPCSPT